MALHLQENASLLLSFLQCHENFSRQSCNLELLLQLLLEPTAAAGAAAGLVGAAAGLAGAAACLAGAAGSPAGATVGPAGAATGFARTATGPTGASKFLLEVEESCCTCTTFVCHFHSQIGG